MIHWILFSTLATVVFYSLYLLLFRRDHWLHLSRWYLITTMMFSIIYPLLQLPESILPKFDGGILPAIEIGATSTSPEAQSLMQEQHQWMELITSIYLIGAAIMFIVLCVQIVCTAIGIIRMPSQGNQIHLIDDNTPPYSFFKHIIVGTNGMSEERLRIILAHEEVHVRQHHTMDVLVMLIMCCVAWFNPIAWLILRELREVHEYLADEAVLSSHGRESYLGLLYQQATGFGFGQITNNFQSINIKKRIAMMNKKKSRFGAWKLLAALPIAALMMMFGCKPAKAQVYDNKTVTATEKSIVQQGDNSIEEEPDTYPEFFGGVESLYSFIAANIRYPKKAKENGIQGTVYVRFVVKADGSISDVNVLRGIGAGCDEEAVRVVKAMPRWKPGTKNGKPINTQYTIPITFKLK